MSPPDLAGLETELVKILTTQGLPAEEIRLIGLLGKGTKATAFSVLINGTHHVLKVYDSSDSLRAELKNLRKVIPRDRFLLTWQEEVEERQINLAIIEVPEGRELNSSLLTPAIAEKIAQRLSELHSIRYRQKVSYTNLVQQLERSRRPFMSMIKLLGRDEDQYNKFYDSLHQALTTDPDLFRSNKVRVHGDLWWANIIVAQEDTYFIDWESVHRGDACEDIAKLRLISFWYRGEVAPTFFWQDPDHGDRLSTLVATIIENHIHRLGDSTIADRLKVYLPLRCVTELAARYLSGATQRAFDVAWNNILADEAMTLFKDPAASPPDLNKYQYFRALEDLRSGAEATS